LRKINPLMRKYKVGLVVINQIRNKVGVMYGDPTTMAAGGNSLEYYLGVNLKTISNKTSDLLKDENKKIIGIKGTVRNKKNKVSVPFKEVPFKLIYDVGLDAYEGLLECLMEDGHVTRSGAWYSYGDTKFQRKDLDNFATDEKFADLRNFLGI